MNYRKSTIKLTLASLILTVQLAGCVTVPSAPAPAPIVVKETRPSNVLPDPPPAVVDALETAGRTDSSAAAWVVALDKFLQKQDAASGEKGN